MSIDFSFGIDISNGVYRRSGRGSGSGLFLWYDWGLHIIWHIRRSGSCRLLLTETALSQGYTANPAVPLSRT